MRLPGEVADNSEDSAKIPIAVRAGTSKPSRLVACCFLYIVHTHTLDISHAYPEANKCVDNVLHCHEL